MIVKAAAKINLMLDVVGKLPNGYHSLFMIMQSVSCYDTVRVDRTGENGIKIISSDERVPKDEKNIAYKAAEAFFDYAGISDRGIEIEIGKKNSHGGRSRRRKCRRCRSAVYIEQAV